MRTSWSSIPVGTQNHFPPTIQRGWQIANKPQTNDPILWYSTLSRWQIRSGEYEGLESKLKKPEWAPDFGQADFVPSWGATVTGVRKFLIAYNINLVSTKEQAHRIALNLRTQGRNGGPAGRLKAVQGIGWWLAEKNIAQVCLSLVETVFRQV